MNPRCRWRLVVPCLCLEDNDLPSPRLRGGLLSIPLLFAGLCMAGVLALLTACGEEGRSLPAGAGGRVLRVAVPPDGLLAPPVYRMEELQPLSASGYTVEVIPWRTPEQLRALVLSGEADFAGLHLSTAALSAACGVEIRFLGASLGNVLYVMAAEPGIETLGDLRGLRVAVPMRGEFPDIMFRSALEVSGLAGEVEVRYVATALDAANLVVTGRVPAAVVAEPHVSILLSRQESGGVSGEHSLRAPVNLQLAWAEARGEAGTPLPTAGMAAIGWASGDGELLRDFWQAYEAAVEWSLANPAEAVLHRGVAGGGGDGADARGGMARALAACVRLPVPSLAERQQIEEFLEVFGRHAPETYGGLTVPESFYWAPVPEGGGP